VRDEVALIDQNVAPTSLRNLPPTDFEDRYGCDRFTAGVLVNKFDFIIKHMVTQVLRTAFSPIVRNSADLAATLNGPPDSGFGVVAVSNTLPLFVGSMSDGVRIALEEYGLASLKHGDVIMVNDYYRVGTHLNDMLFVRPLFSGAELIGAVAIRAHQVDMGGVRPGGFDPTKADVYEDGLVVPPMLLFDSGRPVRSSFALLMANTRFSIIAPDIHSIRAALELGAKLVDESIARYGLDPYFGAARYACDASAEAMRIALVGVPDGVYDSEEFVDTDTMSDAGIVIRLRLIKCGARAEFDFSGSSVASQCAMNASWADSKSAVVMALKCLIDRRTRYTSGSLRDIDIVLPAGSVMNPLPPHSCMYYQEIVQPMIYAVWKALNPVLGPAGIGGEAPVFTFMPTGRGADGRAWSTFSLPISEDLSVSERDPVDVLR
jgi:N-methylhydantoinase B